jgi:hypothetical protein
MDNLSLFVSMLETMLRHQADAAINDVLNGVRNEITPLIGPVTVTLTADLEQLAQLIGMEHDEPPVVTVPVAEVL